MTKKIKVTRELIKKSYDIVSLTRGEKRALELGGYLTSRYERDEAGTIRKVYG